MLHVQNTDVETVVYIGYDTALLAVAPIFGGPSTSQMFTSDWFSISLVNALTRLMRLPVHVAYC